MAADAPWLKWWTDDFLLECVDLSADEIGVLAVLRSLMASRGGPIPDDRRWLARRCGTTTRRLGVILQRLADHEILEHRDGMIGHPPTLEEIARRTEKSGKARTAAMERWHPGQEEMDFEAQPRAPARARTERRETRTLSPEKTGEKTKIISQPKRDKSRKQAKNADANASRPCGRARSSEDSESDSTHPNLNSSDSRGRLADADLKTLYDAVCDAAGFHPVSPTQIDRAMTYVQNWRKAGMDFDLTVLPVIRAEVAKAEEPTRTLGRFRAQIDHAHAKAAARAQAGLEPTVPVEPITEPGDEPEQFRPIRKKLLETLGARAYAMVFNQIRFEDAGESAGRHPIRVKGPAFMTEALTHGKWRAPLMKAARPHGFTEVW